MSYRRNGLAACAAMALGIGACGYGEGSSTTQHQAPAQTTPGAKQAGTGTLPPNANAPQPAAPAPAAESPEDVAVRQAIERKLADAKIAGVAVQVREGRAVLSGRVPAAQYEPAVRAAQEARPAPAKGVDVSGLQKS